MSVAITYENLHRLWPRGDGAVRMLMYLWRIVCQGYVPNFTDAQLAQRFFRKPATIQRWRARWEAHGILLTSFRCQRTFYEINTVALQEAIQAAMQEEEARQMEAKARQLEKKTRLFNEISQNLRSQWTKAHLAGDQNDRSELIKTQDSTTSSPLNQSLVPKEPGNDTAIRKTGVAADDTGSIGNTTMLQLEEARQVNVPLLSQQSLVLGPELDPKDLSQDKMRVWMIEAAKRLVELSGHRWNRNLQRLLDGLDTPAVIRAVSSLWEQSQKGNVKAAPKFLTRAVQRKYSCSKRWSLPDNLPGVSPGPAPGLLDTGDSIIFPDWLPAWSRELLEKLHRQGYALSRYELVDGGIQIWTEAAGVQFFPHRALG